MGEQSRIFLSPPHMGTEEQELVAHAFASNWIAPLGEHVDAFEHEVARYVGTKGALAVSSGTAAIHLGLRLAGVGPGDLVFCSSLTFVASANPILYLGATPVFIDSDEATWNMSEAALARALREANELGQLPKAVVIVHLYGQSADMGPLIALCEQYKVAVVEDAAESLGADYKGRMSGSLGHFGIFSFNGNKIITTSGGGMLVSDDLEALERARFWAMQARERERHYEHVQMGYNYRLSNLLAAVGRGQLRVLEERVAARRRIYQRYAAALQPYAGITFMPESPTGRATRWLTALTVDPEQAGITATQLIDALEKANIEARPVWKPMHRQPLFAGCRYYPHELGYSVSDELYARGVCLPSGSSLGDEQQERVISVIRSCLSGRAKEVGHVHL
ncbi:DegT/DnrJ/EryC1/StrS family aminotransferase [Brevibacillus parabrevis]|uniref:Pyridoxal phosphate-dependent aminotransferase n=1 Tax=Brevibacillus parabrevis TaxID=54914 RepID=A0A4Y3PP60_BREPA|nr:aminotransferase class I/II-fold pyridoxal phosphate-dependent enzyme [Brevibacillus parabrevis]RNB95679.1 aminotransferase class I/II-fold pyridoxal phosphate-dependent enzyme [Brevibacillus parabrevis]GEB32889.1 pyridoxal phosphate-dependent aminotransferase [Brevibacillus parabrevis]